MWFLHSVILQNKDLKNEMKYNNNQVSNFSPQRTEAMLVKEKAQLKNSR